MSSFSGSRIPVMIKKNLKSHKLLSYQDPSDVNVTESPVLLSKKS